MGLPQRIESGAARPPLPPPAAPPRPAWPRCSVEEVILERAEWSPATRAQLLASPGLGTSPSHRTILTSEAVLSDEATCPRHSGQCHGVMEAACPVFTCVHSETWHQWAVTSHQPRWHQFCSQTRSIKIFRGRGKNICWFSATILWSGGLSPWWCQLVVPSFPSGSPAPAPAACHTHTAH